MLKNADIQARIKAIQEDKAERSELTADGILKDIQRLKELAESKGQTASAIRAAELLGKHFALFTEKVRVETESQKFEIFIVDDKGGIVPISELKRSVIEAMQCMMQGERASFFLEGRGECTLQMYRDAFPGDFREDSADSFNKLEQRGYVRRSPIGEAEPRPNDSGRFPDPMEPDPLKIK
jgi:hypothetical protein